MSPQLNLPPDERRAMEEAKKLALRFASAHTKAHFVACDSLHGNLLMPAVPLHLAPSHPERPVDRTNDAQNP